MSKPHLNTLQRLKRRLSLLGGSYTWPDGHIELDFDQGAGIEHGDDSQTQDEKLARYHAMARRPIDGVHGMGGLLIGAGVGILANDLGVSNWHAALSAMMVGIGVSMAVTGRLKAW